MYLDKFKLDGQTAFVTGGGRGIGLASAEALLEAGAQVIISDQNPDVLESGRAQLEGEGYEIGTMILDVTDADAVGRVAAERGRTGSLPRATRTRRVERSANHASRARF